MNYFYVYKVSLPETGEYYFGSRKCKCIPEKDTKYMGSMCTWKPNVNKLIKEILYTNFSTHQDALLKETELIKEHIKDPLNQNYSLPNGDLYIHSPKEWILKKHGEKEGHKILAKMYENNSSIWKRGNKPWNTGKKLSAEHLQNIQKTWHSEKRIKVMQSEEYRNKMSKLLSGDKNPMFKKTIYETWYIKYGKEIADKNLEEWHKNKSGQIPWNKGIPASEESKVKNRAANSNRAWIYNDNLQKNKRIKITELENFLQNGWKQGYKKY